MTGSKGDKSLASVMGLLKSADHILNLARNDREDNKELESALKGYADLFQTWLHSVGDLSAHVKDISAEERAALIKLEQLHSEVLGIAATAMGQVSAQLKELRVRGKGIMAYTDVLPKRVSLRGQRKG